MTECSIDKTEKGEAEISCVIGNETLQQNIIFEQQILRNGLEELLTFGSIKSESEMTCAEGNITLIDNGTDITLIDNGTEIIETDFTDEHKESDDTNDTDKTDKTDSPDRNETREDISISFRQINGFAFNKAEKTVSIFLFALLTEEYTAKTEFTIEVNLIGDDGEMEENTTELICLSEKDIKPSSEGHPIQGDFKCSAKVTKEYYSLRLNSSESIAGIPTEEELLDPKLTEQAIIKGKLLDYSKDENKGEDKMPPTFDIEEINVQGDEIIINGTMSKEMKHNIQFTIPLSKPEGASIICSLTSLEDKKAVFTCKVDREINDVHIIFEQITIKDGINEVISFKGFKSPETIQCENGILNAAKKRMKIPISFRQVSHFEKISTGFKFFFAALLSPDFKETKSMKMKMNVIIGNTTTEKDAICTLEKDVKPDGDKQVQGDFTCTLEEKEIDNVANITVSENNEEISGVSELEEEDKNPKVVDEKIEETKQKIEKNEEITELEECIDYSIEENKKIVPPSFEISEYLNIDKCSTKGKFKIKGKFSEKIKDGMTFFLPLTFPKAEIKCKALSAEANEDVEITCKVQKGFKNVNSFVVEKRMVKKRHKEMVFITNKETTANTFEKIECLNYNDVKLMKVKERRKNAHFSFLQLSNFKPEGRKISFFMALMKIKKEASFDTPITIPIIVEIKSSRNNLRHLEETKEVNATCKKNENGEIGDASGLDCSNDDVGGTATNMTINTDELGDISGVPNDATPIENPSVDYSSKEQLEKVKDLATVTIESIDGSTCEDDGDFKINGKVEGTLTDQSEVEIPFGYPDSSSLCDVKVSGQTVNMNCHNKDKFEASSIVFENSVIENKFKLNEYTNKDKFACTTSVYSEKKSSDGETINNFSHELSKKKHNKLSAGGIVAIVLAIVAVLAIIGAIVGYMKSKSGQIPKDLRYKNDSTLAGMQV